MRAAAAIVALLFSSQALAGPVTYAVKGTSGVTMYTPTTTYTKTLDPAYGQITGPTNAADIATTALVVQKSIDKGFRADDPRVGVTIDAIQKKGRDISTGAATGAFGGAAAAVLTGAALGTPVGWGAIAVSALVAGGVAAATPLFAEALDYAIDAVTGFISSSSSSPAGGTGYYYMYSVSSVWHIGNTPMAAFQSYLDTYFPGNTVVGCNWNPDAPKSQRHNWTCTSTAWQASTLNDSSTHYASTLTSDCSSGAYTVATGVCTPSSSSPVASAPKSAPEFFAAPPDAARSATITSPAIAQLVSELWKEAYKDNPSILPPSPITSGDVDTFRSLNPEIKLNGESMTAPPTSAPATVSPSSPTSTSPDGSVYPGTSGLLQPSAAPAPAPTAEAPKPDIGPDPNIGAPSLESIPTSEMILAPVLGLMPDLRSYVVPSHSAECPKPSIDLWEKHLVLQDHCTVLEGVRPVLYAIMAAVWLMVAVFIILAA